MKIGYNPVNGLVTGAEVIESPNFDSRPAGMVPEVLIIHSISLPPCEFGGTGITDLFTNCLDPDDHPYYRDIAALKVSSHLLVRRDGELIQYVPLTQRAWHAGESECEGRCRVNDFSIGIELEGCDQQAFTDAQYDVLVDLTNLLFAHFVDITPERIYGHCDIASGRKTDPGPNFNWALYRARLGIQVARR
jgi:AmpD protein